MGTVYIKNEDIDHIVLKNDTGANLAQYEFTVIGGLSLIADEAIVNAATGSFHVESGLIFQTTDLETGEDTFGTENAPVYWNPTSGDFSDTVTTGYYLIGIVKTIKDSNGMIIVTKNYQAVKQTVSLSGLPFYKTATLTSAAAGTAVDILTDDEVDGGTVVITDFLLNVNGATAWTDSTGTVVKILDGADVVGITAAKAQLTDSALLDLLATGITLGDPIKDGVGFTAANGILIEADSDFDAGSDIIVTVSGYVIG